jgi:pSer/pThr/pTyr-binding forkhead associated (FHA) protein
MSSTVTLTATKGPLAGAEFRFGSRTLCLLGRSGACLLQVPDAPDTRDISRRHCLLDVDPPAIRIRDLGSRNGTYVNGHKIGQRPARQSPEEAQAPDAPDYALHEGDMIRMGGLVLRVGIVAEDTSQPESEAAGRREPACCLG